MQNIQGFLLLNIYALLMIVITSVIFFRKERQKQIEDETYARLLIVTILVSVSGIILGIMVNPEININEFLITISNKIYLVFLSYNFNILYILYIFIKKNKDREDKKNLYRNYYIQYHYDNAIAYRSNN